MQEDTQPPVPGSSLSAKQPSPVNKKAAAIAARLLLLAIIVSVLANTWVMAQRTDKESKKRADDLSHQVAELKARTAALEEPQKAVEKAVKKDQYQAVFLASEQVYFGKITQVTKDTLKLEDIYYLRTGSVDRSGNTVSGDANLVKLGEEVHGPEDVMVIERKNVSFWENLKPDGQVSKAITEYKKANP